MLKSLIENIKMRYWVWQAEREYQDIEETYEFIWGLKSYTDLTGADCCLHTMNDIDIVYDKESKKYSIGIETAYLFQDGVPGEKKYVQRLFDRLTEWMIENGYDINRDVGLYEVFTKGDNLNTKFDSIEELYATFKFLVKGFINQ